MPASAINRLAVYFTLGGYLIALVVARQHGLANLGKLVDGQGDAVLYGALGLPLAIVLGFILVSLAEFLEYWFREFEESMNLRVVEIVGESARDATQLAKTKALLDGRLRLFWIRRATFDLIVEFATTTNAEGTVVWNAETVGGIDDLPPEEQPRAIRRSALNRFYMKRGEPFDYAVRQYNTYQFAVGTMVATAAYLLFALTIDLRDCLANFSAWSLMAAFVPVCIGVVTTWAAVALRRLGTSSPLLERATPLLIVSCMLPAAIAEHPLDYLAASSLPILLRQACLMWWVVRKSVYRYAAENGVTGGATAKPELGRGVPAPAFAPQQARSATTTKYLYSLKRSSGRQFHLRTCKYVVDEADDALERRPESRIPRSRRCRVCC